MDYSSGGDSFDIDSRSADSYIERNIFYRVHGLFINPEGKVVHVRNNIFYGNSYGLKPVGSSGHFIIQHNSFLHFIDHAIELEPDTFFPILAMINYWNTTDTNVIDSLIWDASDDLNIFYYVEYIPFLTEPHPDTPIFPIPNAEFTADLTSGFQPLTVDFTDKSIGEIDSWEWNFGDGSPASFEQNPTHIYDQPGIYSVSLTVNDSSGFDTEDKTDYITVNKAEPTPDIKLNGTEGPLYVSTSESVAVTISLDPGIYTGTPADWWIGVKSLYGVIPFLGQPIPIFELQETILLDIPLPTGVWIFYFILDDIPNGQLDNVTWSDYGVVVSLPE
jgi:PKD repeat protein